MSDLTALAYWTRKIPTDNAWHPDPRTKPRPSLDTTPTWLARADLAAAVVDTAPFVCGAGGLAHLRQLPTLGWTVPASVFRNPRTLTAMHRTVMVLLPLVLGLQAVGRYEYRDYIPRWAHERERRRDEDEVRAQVEVGMGFGTAVWVARMIALRAGRVYWAPIEVVMGGALADLAHREYCKAHGL